MRKATRAAGTIRRKGWRLRAVREVIKIMKTLMFTLLMVGMSFAQSITIDLAKGSDREQQTKARLEKAIDTYDLRKYTFNCRA